MAVQAGIGSANASGTSAGTGRSASRARLALSIASAPRTSPTSAFAKRFQPRHLDFGAQHVGLGSRPARVPRVRRGHDVPREADLFGDQRRRSASLLQHQEGIGGLDSHVQRRPVRVRAKPVEIRQRGGPTMAADPGQRDPLLDRDAHVRAAQHERQVVERGRDHRVFERRDDGRPRLSGARARARGLDLVSSLACDANDVRQTERRRERGRRLGRRPDRPERRRNREEKSESKTCGTFHVDHRMLHALRPGRRHRRPG